MTEQVVKSKDLRRQTKEWMAVFFKKCVKNIIEKSVSICVIIPQNRKDSLEEKKAVHTSRKHGVRRICQLYTKGGPVGKLT